ncbi:CaMKI [Symbiodinium natans]|uniref:CaMKI protein n=1 Tax=Symbiodinium natans TaxID=878477 RepID=A0A812RJA5_9DINO|nr:CaMKI [Symbiodinium natans]
MKDKDDNRLVAVKIMPNRWVGTSHTNFVIDHPSETELPWQDLGCVRFLNDVGFPYACELLGVYRDVEHTYVVTTFATEGDLFSWCEGGVAPGHEREIVVQPIARQLMEGIQQLHDFGIVHRDLSLENVLMTKTDSDVHIIKIIDFSMASTARSFRNCIRGKASYQAPELHTDQEYDAYLTDAFSVGVTLYAVLLKDYPWLSTRPGGCKCFEYVKKHGFRACPRRNMRLGV